MPIAACRVVLGTPLAQPLLRPDEPWAAAAAPDAPWVERERLFSLEQFGRILDPPPSKPPKRESR
jgi:hypothetical protein